MGANRKQAEAERKAFFERRLKDRISLLSKKGIEPPQAAKDTIVKNLRANIEAINVRLKTIARYEEQTTELAKRKAEKAAVPRKDAESGKGKKEKEVAEAPAEDEGKKEKKEKTKKKKEAAS